ncbi:N-(5'-phosphoribosyl)anthranilate isomerase [Endozoicomonas numazuensis]|uniref:N-(5'-phosphoribosyl)anthranilate isomerase n=2 Tax=Endozoicomonas numazuensis TaxID=1137799 RepID=A0A081N3S7_9GAMM|nr:N-(5'-phosphoribosyl)anthranilate isomerase [Endozoicomonas numazuensis]
MCGVTSIEEALQAVEAGVDALGLVFYPPSKRFVSVEKASEIAFALPPFITLVGLFVDADEAAIQTVLDRVPLDLLQFHGNETDQECERWRRKYIKALRVRPGTSIEECAAAYPGACGLLLDSYRKGVPGGTGEAFDWQLIPDNLDKPIILAGGLNPENVSQAIEQVAPYAVDVSSGVESGVENERGKDPEKMKAFVEAVKQ